MPRLTLTALLACFALAACGADGEPQAPTEPGIKITGEAEVGVVVKK
jgi:hypothetical protein